MPTVLISGANRGIGLELARQYRADDWDVFATARDPDKAGDLRATGATALPLDAADCASIAALAGEVGAAAIDLLIANAGIWAANELDPEAWVRVLQVNTLGPVLLAEALKPNVARSEHKMMIAMTSGMGSIGDNDSGRFVAYRSSKAALNAAWKTLALDWRGDGIVMAVMNPGWVKTDMGGPSASITVEQSVTGIRREIASLTPDRSGSFLSYDGKRYPW